jgi:hypothetical protein
LTHGFYFTILLKLILNKVVDMKDGIAEFVFTVSVGDKVCLVQADQAVLLDCGTVRFIVHNDAQSTVAVFKEYDYFFTEANNEKI